MFASNYHKIKMAGSNANTNADNANTNADNANTNADNANTNTDNANTNTDNANTNTDNANPSSTFEVKISAVNAMKFFDTDVATAEKLRFTNVSLYSTTPPDQAKYTANLLEAFYSLNELKNVVVTDGTSCIGGNIVELSRKVKHVNCVEINNLHVEILKHNLQTLACENCTVYESNYLKCYDTLNGPTKVQSSTILPTLNDLSKQHVIFMDPPWGGVNYKSNVSSDLYLIDSDISIREFISKFIKYLCQVLILKIPTNAEHCENIKKQNAFPYCKVIDITALDGRALYTIVILANIKPIDESKLTPKAFPRLGYKMIEYTKI